MGGNSGTDRMDAIRSQLATLASRKKARTTAWTRDRPTHWSPSKYIDPRTGCPFTRDGAWDFVVEKLTDETIVLEEIELTTQKGKKGYVVHVDTEHAQLYIKLQFGNGGKIIGLSFHD